MCFISDPFYNLRYTGDNNHYGFYQSYPTYIEKKTSTNPKPEACRCCNGTGTQLNKDKIWIRCPGCKGTGLW